MGLQSTLLLKKPQPRFQGDKPYVEIIFDKEDHLIVASTVFSRSKVYDSVLPLLIKRQKQLFPIYMYQKFYLIWLVLVNRKVVQTVVVCSSYHHNFSTRT